MPVTNYDEADGPMMTLELPVAVVETLVDVAYRYVTPSMGLDGMFVDELREQLAEARKPVDLAVLIQRREDANDAAEAAQVAIDEHLDGVLAAYFDFRHEIGLRNQCSPGDYRFDSVSREGYFFSHDCFNHGYDLHDIETVDVPREFVIDREAYTTRVRAEVEAKNKKAAEARRAALLAELETLS